MSARPTASGGRARLPREARFEALLEAAASVLAERGRAGVTMEAVAARGGVDKALAYRHFANRDEIVATLYERAITAFDARIERAIASADSFAGEIEAIVEVWLDDIERNGLVMQLVHGAQSSPALEARRHERLGASARFIAERIRVHHPMPPRDALLAAAVFMAGTQGLIAGRTSTRSSRSRVVSRFVAMVVGAVERLARDASVAARHKSR